MQEILIRRLHEYLVSHNPQVVYDLQQEGRYTAYLHGKVDSIHTLLSSLFEKGTPAFEVEHKCVAELTAEYGPSRFRYVMDVLEQEFPAYYEKITDGGILNFVVMNFVHVCDASFDKFSFCGENQENRLLRYAVIGAISAQLGEAA